MEYLDRGGFNESWQKKQEPLKRGTTYLALDAPRTLAGCGGWSLDLLRLFWRYLRWVDDFPGLLSARGMLRDHGRGRFHTF